MLQTGELTIELPAQHRTATATTTQGEFNANLQCNQAGETNSIWSRRLPRSTTQYSRRSPACIWERLSSSDRLSLFYQLLSLSFKLLLSLIHNQPSGLVYIATLVLSPRIRSRPDLLLPTYTSLLDIFILSSVYLLSSRIVFITSQFSLFKMHISDMLNPESLSEKGYSSQMRNTHGCTQNAGTPRSAVAPAFNATQFNSISPMPPYSYGYDTYSTQSYPAPSDTNRHAYDVTPPSTQSTHHRTPTGGFSSSWSIGTSGGSYDSSRGNNPKEAMHTSMHYPHQPMLLPDKSHANIDVNPHGLSKLAPAQASGSLTALAILATSRDSRGTGGTGCSESWRWRDAEHSWSQESPAWGRAQFGDIHRESHTRRAVSPHDIAVESG